MIPPRILKELATRLTEQTRSGKTTWHRASHDAQRYTAQLPGGQLVVHYSPSRGASDTIELAVLDGSGSVIGSLVAVENEPTYDLLADLLFEVQRKNDPGGHAAVTDAILKLLNS